jgi:hypothetical protein
MTAIVPTLDHKYVQPSSPVLMTDGVQALCKAHKALKACLP